MGWLKDTFGGNNGASAVGNLLLPGLQDAAGALGLGPKVAMPTLQKAELDPNANEILNQRAARSQLPGPDADQQIVDEQNKGIDEAGGLLSAGAMDSPMQQAIERRQQKEFASLTNKMRRSDMSDAPLVQGQRTASTIGAIRNDAANAINFAQKQKQAEQNKKFARNNAINTVFRSGGALVGTVVGGYLGTLAGNPEMGAKAGAMGGSAFGSGVGNTVGGQTGDLQYL